MRSKNRVDGALAQEARGIELVKVAEPKSAAAIRRRPPTPYGVFATVLDGRLLSYRHMTPQEFEKAVNKTRR